MNSLETPKCVLCGIRDASPTGEHVWPSWYLRDWDHVPPTFVHYSHNGQPILDRNSNPVTPNERVRVKLPVCAECNNILSLRFEQSPTKDILRDLFASGGSMSLMASEAKLVGEWFAKTLLLLSHPDVRYANERIDPYVVRLRADEAPPSAMYQWLTSGEKPPNGISVWLHRVEMQSDRRAAYAVPLPKIVANGQTTSFVEMLVAKHGLGITLVVHPNWSITHPLEERGHALRIVPASENTVDLTQLPVLWPHVVRWSRCIIELKPGDSLESVDLPPLRHTANPFDVVSEVLPLVQRWSV